MGCWLITLWDADGERNDEMLGWTVDGCNSDKSAITEAQMVQVQTESFIFSLVGTLMAFALQNGCKINTEAWQQREPVYWTVIIDHVLKQTCVFYFFPTFKLWQMWLEKRKTFGYIGNKHVSVHDMYYNAAISLLWLWQQQAGINMCCFCINLYQIDSLCLLTVKKHRDPLIESGALFFWFVVQYCLNNLQWGSVLF